MKKAILILPLIVLVIALSGCTEQPLGEFDCDENLDCFKERLLFCREAKVKNVLWGERRGAVLRVVEPGKTAVDWPDWEEYYTTKTSIMEIDSFDGSDETGYCLVKITDLNVLSGTFRNSLMIDDEELWKEAQCVYLTNNPDVNGDKMHIPVFYNCYPASETAITPVSRAERKVYFELGESVSDGRLNVTVNEFSPIAFVPSSGDYSYGTYPSENKIFVSLDVTAENISEKEQELEKPSIKCIGEGFADFDYTATQKAEGGFELYPKIAPNETKTGVFVYEIGDDCNGLEIWVKFYPAYKKFYIIKLDSDKSCNAKCAERNYRESALMGTICHCGWGEPVWWTPLEELIELCTKEWFEEKKQKCLEEYYDTPQLCEQHSEYDLIMCPNLAEQICKPSDLTKCDGIVVTITGKLEKTEDGSQVINGVMLYQKFDEGYVGRIVEVKGLLDLYYGKRMCDAGIQTGDCWEGGHEFGGSGPVLTEIEYIMLIE